MAAALAEAPHLLQQLSSDLLEKQIDWSKTRSMEVVEMLHEREILLKQKERLKVESLADFLQQYHAVHEHRILEDKVSR